jgi:hypothetical protein
MRSAREELPKRRRQATIGEHVLIAISVAVNMRLMTLELLFVAKRVAFLSNENRLPGSTRDKEARAKRGLMGSEL